MKNISVLALSLLVSVGVSYGQQLEQSNLYEFNKFKINPAFAGSEECVNFTVGHLAQWVGFDGAPQTSYINGSGQVGNNTGLGGRVMIDRLGSMQRMNVNAAYAYRLNFGDDHNLRLGIGAGIIQQSFNFSGSTIQDVTDESIVTGTANGMSFYSEFGLVYNLKRFQLGASMPNLLETNANLDPTVSGRIENSRHLVGMIGYDFGGEKLTVTPSVLYKHSFAGEFQIDGNLLFNIKEIIQLGLGYRHNAGILGRFGVTIDDRFQVAYAYGHATTDIAMATSGSHEVILGFKICKGNNKAMPPEIITNTDTVFVENSTVPDTVIVEKLVEVKEDKKESDELEYTVYFELAKSTFDVARDKEGLTKIADYLKENSDEKIYIKGYASEEGSDYGNFKLSGSRAKKVYAYMIELGVDRSQMISIVQGEVGEHHGADSNEDQKLNRKVRLVFVN